ncbi:MAG: hypothetical protein L3K26_10225 [Candidatus Hydrogenedentes bacterium]|nr:hypothetical protein [Candidatus Hydrogenedentota bacterium]
MVAVFCGRVLPLDRDIMGSEDIEAKRGHLSEILGNFLHDRIERLFGEGDVEEEIAYDPIDSEGEADGEVNSAHTGL